MAQDPKKRQKKLEQKKAKRKEKRQELAKHSNAGLLTELKAAAAYPIFECWRTADLLDAGIGQVMISRQLKDGTILFCLFLVDTYCLGVKNVMLNRVGRFEYSQKFATHNFPHEQVDMDPTAARKLVEGAVAFAKSCGLSAHSDYNKARLIFGDIDTVLCTDEFSFGKEGKPLFINGPNDSTARCKQVINILKNTLGEGNFECTILLGESQSGSPKLAKHQDVD